jgi:hypothetical protein
MANRRSAVRHCREVFTLRLRVVVVNLVFSIRQGIVDGSTIA